MKTPTVASEFSQLKRLVLSESEFHTPDPEKSNSYATNFLATENQGLFTEKFGEFKTVYPEWQARWEAEKIAMCQVLESHGVEVLRPRRLTEAEKRQGRESGQGYSNFFARDPFFTVGSFIIEGNLRFSHRQLEGMPLREILLDAGSRPGVSYLATPRPSELAEELAVSGPYLEGGDVLVYYQTIFVGYSGLASDSEGIKWLTHFLQPAGYRVIPVRLHPDVLHLDCVLSFLREGLMIVCEEAFLDGIPEELADWDRIDIDLVQAAQLMANGLSINEDIYITDVAFTELIPKIEAYGIQVVTLDYQISRLFGGSFRCTTQVLERSDE